MLNEYDDVLSSCPKDKALGKHSPLDGTILSGWEVHDCCTVCVNNTQICPYGCVMLNTTSTGLNTTQQKSWVPDDVCLSNGLVFPSPEPVRCYPRPPKSTADVAVTAVTQMVIGKGAETTVIVVPYVLAGVFGLIAFAAILRLNGRCKCFDYCCRCLRCMCCCSPCCRWCCSFVEGTDEERQRILEEGTDSKSAQQSPQVVGKKTVQIK